jgi:hypothetical protein
MTSSFCTTWPHGKTAAASFCFDLDAESAVLSFAPQAASRMSVMSHQSYGPLTGVPRRPSSFRVIRRIDTPTPYELSRRRVTR